MAGSDKINSHPMENNDNARINLTGAELKALVDDAVKKALERQYEEYSGTRSRTLSIPHSKPPSKKDEPKKEDDECHPSNNHSDPSQQIILNQGPHDKGCSYKYFISCKPRDFTGENGAVDFRGMAAKASENGKRKREDENSRRSDRKSSGLKRDSQQSVEKTKCETCRKYHLGKCKFESQPLPCGICKSQEHKTLDCEKLKDATCYGCNERGHVKTNCPKNQKKPEEAKRTNA
ncbi:zinc finger CCHC domain-containing protein 9-like [Helianthus annuus]|uniref:zinc finger CCHC domain-containing protein 9-like n=1 Tax=Helianthus annuus TaxID=4232 RepID=UPI001653128C|nr:zinc finger CCHC domain-containing protein 9-like [Helianthus annuus]